MTAARQPEGPPSTFSMGFNSLQRPPTPSDLKNRVMTNMRSCDTTFFALSRRLSPVAHLQTLRGAQDEPLLHTDEFMSPALHNSSDSYQRLLRAQLFYSHELSQGLHQRQWLKKIEQRKSFNDFASHLEYHSYPFLHGFHNQMQKEEDEKYFHEERKEDYLLREEEGMERRGWAPEDWGMIQRAIVQENMMAEREIDLDRSYDTVETTVSSVFDDDGEEESTDDEDQYDHLYSFDDGKPAAQRTSDEGATIQEIVGLEQEFRPVITTKEFASSDEITKAQFDTEPPSLVSDLNGSDSESEEESTEEESSEEDDSEVSDEESDEEDDNGVPPAISSAPSRLLSSIFRLGGDDSDSDEEEVNMGYDNEIRPCSPSPPASIYFASSAIVDTESEVDNNELSPAHRRQLEFLTDLQSVRTQTKFDMEAEAEHNAINHAHIRRKQDLSHCNSNIPTYLVSLRLHMSSNGLYPVDSASKVHFKCNRAVGKHEVEFKGALRHDMMDKRETQLGGLVERAFWVAKRNGDWAYEMENDMSFAILKDASHMAAQLGESEEFKNEMKEVVRMAQQIQYAAEFRAKQAIEHALWHDDKMLGIEISEEDADAQICWND